MGDKHTEVPSPGIAAFIEFAAQDNSVRFDSTGTSALHILSIGDARDCSLIDRGLLTTSLTLVFGPVLAKLVVRVCHISSLQKQPTAFLVFPVVNRQKVDCPLGKKGGLD